MENIAWKTPLPGLGHASPIVVGNQIFIVTAVSDDPDSKFLRPGLYGDIASVAQEARHAWRLYCLDKRSGRIQWVRTLHEGPATAGVFAFRWDGRDASGRALPGGVYLIELRAEGRTRVEKGILLR